MNSPYVSVVIPTFNRAYCIERAIRSVLAQEYEPMEVLIIDDGSSDGTQEIVSSINDKRIRYTYKRNGGVSSARNLGIREARGEWVAFLDSDDLWLPGKLQLQATVIGRMPEVGLVCTDWSGSGEDVFFRSYIKNYFMVFRTFSLHFDDIFPAKEDISVLHQDGSRTTYRLYSGNVFEKLLLGNFVPTSTVVAQKRFLEESGGFDESFRTAEDADLYLRFSARYQLAYVDTPTVEYALGLSDKLSDPSFYLEMNLNTLKSMERALAENPQFRPQDDRLLKKRFFMKRWEIGKTLLAAGRNADARRYFLKAWRDLPGEMKAPLGIAATFFPSDLVKRVYRKVFGG